MTEPASLFDRAGGIPFFEALVARFYAGVAADPGSVPSTPKRTWHQPNDGSRSS
jgi:truncated hemoglobin YjbI